MRRDVERRLSALESQSTAQDGHRVILLVPAQCNQTGLRTYRDCLHDLAWGRAPEETVEEFKAKAVAEAENIAKAENRVMMLAPQWVGNRDLIQQGQFCPDEAAQAREACKHR